MLHPHVTRRYAYAGHTEPVYTLALGPGGSFYSAGGDGVVAEWNPATGENIRAVFKAPAPLYSLCYIPGRELLIAGQNDGGLQWFELATNRVLRSARVHSRGAFDVLPILEHGLLACAGGDGVLSLWQLDTQTCLLTAQVSSERLRSLALSPQGDHLAVGASDGMIRIFDAASLKPVQAWQAHSNSVFTLAYSPDGRYLYSGSRDAHLRTWDRVERYEMQHDVVAHTLTIHHLSFSPDGRYLATAAMDKTLKLWDAATLKLLKVIDHRRNQSHTTGLNRVLWLPSLVDDVGTLYRLLTCSDDRQVLQWDVRFGAE